jgi:hypothetical protein
METSYTPVVVPSSLREALPARTDLARCTLTTWAEIEDEVRPPQAPPAADAVVVILPGWWADDGYAHVDMHYPDIESPEQAAQEYVDTGNWGDRTATEWIDIYTWRIGYVIDADGDVIDVQIGRCPYTITLDAEEPPCDDEHDHDWQEWRVSGHGGGVIITEACAHCGAYRITDTWAQRRDTGEQGLESVEYQEADEDSLAWLEEQRSE